MHKLNKSEDQMSTVALQQCMGGAVGRQWDVRTATLQKRGRREEGGLLCLRVQNWILEVVKECQGAAQAAEATPSVKGSKPNVFISFFLGVGVAA